MRLALPIVLAACGVSSTTRTKNDAAVDAPRLQDARPPDASIDAYVRRACDAPPMFADGRTPTRVVHVSPGAVGGDGSAARPFGSIEAAAAVATPGTFIQLAPGVHATDQFVPDLRGTASAPIWIGGAFGTRPVLRGGSEAIHLTRPAYVVIQHLAIRGATANGINIDDGVSHGGDAHHIAIVDVDVSDVWTGGPDACVRVAGGSDVAIYDSHFDRCGNAVDLIGTHRAVVARNVIEEVVLWGVQTRGGSTDVDVRQNRFRDAGNAAVVLGGSTPISEFRPPLSTTSANAEARRIRAFDNVVNGSTLVPFMFSGCSDCLVAHNLTYGAPTSLLRIRQGTPTQGSYTFEPTQGGRVINNSFVWSTALAGQYVEVGPSTAVNTFTFATNLWHATLAPESSAPALPVTETGSVIGEGTGYTYDATNGYCLGPEAHRATPLPEVDGTIEGSCRADGDGPTIGPQVVDDVHCIPI